MGAKGGNEEDMSMNMNPLQKQMLEREAAIAAEAASALALPITPVTLLPIQKQTRLCALIAPMPLVVETNYSNI